MWKAGVCQAVSAGQIDAQHFVPCIIFEVFQQAERKYPGVVNQDVYALEMLDRRINQ
jgi:hypothetical protein